MMKRFFIMCCALIGLSSCCNSTSSEITIDVQNHENEAYNLSYELATAVKEAKNYEEFKAASDKLRVYEEAFRTQIGGDSYSIFLEESNYILNEI